MWEKLKYILTPKEKRKLFVLSVIVVAGSFLELMGVSIFMPFINIVMNTDTIFETEYLYKLYVLGDFKNPIDFVVATAGGIIFIYIFKNIYLSIEKNAIYKYSYDIQNRTSVGLLKAYMKEPYTFHTSKNMAELQRSMQEDCDWFTKGIIHLMELVAEVVVCIVMGVYLLYVSWSITLVVVGLLAACILLFTYIIKKYSKKLAQDNQVYKGEIYKWMNQALGGIKEIKVLSREDFFVENYERYFSKYVIGLRINRLIGILPKYLVETVCMVGLMGAIMGKILLGQVELIDFLPQLSVFAVAAFRLMPSVGRINEHLSSFLYSLPSLELIYNDLKNVANLHGEKKIIDSEWKLEKKIQVSQISYHYPDSEENILEDVSLEIEKGKMVAFIGPSGAGKTTLIDILLGVLEPQKGEILADGMDIEKNLGTWQKEIGYIPQVIYLSDDTIRNNIAFGVEADRIDEEAIEAALKQSQLYDFIQMLPNGLNTLVGDRGVRLSGGQRQRIGIARALYHNPEILVLDEATSALDNETETAVMEAINGLQGIKTMIIIAHRLTTIRNADVIYEVSQGKVRKVSKEEVYGKEE